MDFVVELDLRGVMEPQPRQQEIIASRLEAVARAIREPRNAEDFGYGITPFIVRDASDAEIARWGWRTENSRPMSSLLRMNPGSPGFDRFMTRLETLGGIIVIAGCAIIVAAVLFRLVTGALHF